MIEPSDMKGFSKNQIDQAQSYCELMGQLKVRIDALRNMLTREFFAAHPERIALESCYLQMRMITEVIALACLTANGNTPGARSKWIRKETSADAIMNALSSLNPEFYPYPEQQVRDDSGGWKGGMMKEGGFIKRKALTALYGQCGDQLHIGSLSLQGRKTNKGLDHHIKLLNGALAGIVGLLQWHTIVTFDPRVQFWVDMVPIDGGPPSVKLIRADGATDEFLQQLSKHRTQVDRHG
jgi:hypothetical protein